MDNGIFFYLGIAVILLISGFFGTASIMTNQVIDKVQLVKDDTNALLANDLAMAQYIQYNSQTLEYINNNCKVTSDTNEITVLTCIKVKQ